MGASLHSWVLLALLVTSTPAWGSTTINLSLWQLWFPWLYRCKCKASIKPTGLDNNPCAQVYHLAMILPPRSYSHPLQFGEGVSKNLCHCPPWWIQHRRLVLLTQRRVEYRSGQENHCGMKFSHEFFHIDSSQHPWNGGCCPSQRSTHIGGDSQNRSIYGIQHGENFVETLFDGQGFVTLFSIDIEEESLKHAKKRKKEL